MRNWHKRFFDPDFYNPASEEAVAAARGEAVFMARALGLGKGMSVLDLCCGPGRHSLEFARMGFDVTGLDITAPYLAQARAQARRLGLKARFVRGDMRRMGRKGEFDAAVCVFTSFGYYSRAQDLAALRSVAQALKPGGKFLIDVLDRRWLDGRCLSRNWEAFGDGSFRLEENSYDRRSGRMRSSWTLLRPGRRPQTRGLELNLYDEQALGALLRRAGLVPLKRWRRLSSADRGTDNRLVLLAARPKRQEAKHG